MQRAFQLLAERGMWDNSADIFDLAVIGPIVCSAFLQISISFPAFLDKHQRLM